MKSMPANGMGSATTRRLNAVSSAGSFSHLLADFSAFTENVSAALHTVFWPLVPQVLDILIVMFVVLMMIWVCIKHIEWLCQDVD